MAAIWMGNGELCDSKWVNGTEMASGRHMASIWRPYGVHMADKWITVPQILGDTNGHPRKENQRKGKSA